MPAHRLTRGSAPAAVLLPGDRFDRAVRGVLSWTCQRARGIAVHPQEPPAREATFLLLIRPVGLGYLVASTRVVYLIEEADRRGFAYGTLTGHPEQGEESFTVVRARGRLRFELLAFTRARAPLARAIAPVVRLLQLQASRRYLRISRRLVRPRLSSQ